MPETTIDFKEPMPLFPLAACVVLPHTTIPLHVFEDRYTAMINDSLRNNKLIAMAMFEGTAWIKNYNNNPALRHYVCVGRIAKHEKTPDGRFHIFLQGLCRAKLIQEIENQPYRLGTLEPTEISKPIEIDLDECRQKLERLIYDPVLTDLASISALNNWLSGEIPTTALIDQAILISCNDSEQRYAMLEENCVYNRSSWLIHYLLETKNTLLIAKHFGTPLSNNGDCLN